MDQSRYLSCFIRQKTVSVPRHAGNAEGESLEIGYVNKFFRLIPQSNGRSLVTFILDIQANRTGQCWYKATRDDHTQFQRMLHILINNIFQSKVSPRFPSSQTHPLLESFQSFLRFPHSSPPPRSVSSFQNRKLHGSPQRLIKSSFLQDRTSALSARPRSTQRGLFASRW